MGQNCTGMQSTLDPNAVQKKLPQKGAFAKAMDKVKPPILVIGIKISSFFLNSNVRFWTTISTPTSDIEI